MTGQSLWIRYSQERSPEDREQLLLMNLPLVHHVARRMTGALRSGVELDDLVGAGTIGLMSAVEHFEPERGLAFSTFAAPRIRGAILDDLRRRDPASRSVRRKERELARAREAAARRRQRVPRGAEIARELGIDLEGLWRWEQDAARARPDSLDRPIGQEGGSPRALGETMAGDTGAEVVEALDRRQLVGLLKDAIEDLGERERVVLSLYYFEEMKMREIADVLGVTESRVSQLRTKALKELRERVAHLRDDA